MEETNIATLPSIVLVLFTNLLVIILVFSLFPTSAASASPMPHAKIEAIIIYLYSSPNMPHTTLIIVMKTIKAILILLFISPGCSLEVHYKGYFSVHLSR